MRSVGLTILLLSLSNVFMTFAWYAHLKELGNQALDRRGARELGHRVLRVLLQVPGNRIGYTVLSWGSSSSCRK